VDRVKHIYKNNKEKKADYKRTLFIGIILIAFGVIFSTNFSESLGSLGIIFIAVGGLFFIISMSAKKREEDTKNNKK
jgi:hypothetical protein